MSSNQQTSTACCTIPPIIAKDYQHKGDYQTIAGLRTYTTGPAEATHGILMISDVFGFFPQTIQGADILAYADNEKPYRVFMPDWFDGEPMPIEWYPPDTDDKKKNLGNFFATKAAPQTTVAKIPGVVAALHEAAPAIKTWGFLGLCWGAKRPDYFTNLLMRVMVLKIVSLCSAEDTPFKAAAEVHPALVDRKDAPHITIPILMLASQDEDPKEVEAFKKDLKVAHHVEFYSDQVHGWMGARADLEQERSRSEYERGYKKVLSWFHEYL